VLVNIVVD